jgi:hypothetical protein
MNANKQVGRRTYDENSLVSQPRVDNHSPWMRSGNGLYFANTFVDLSHNYR